MSRARANGGPMQKRLWGEAVLVTSVCAERAWDRFLTTYRVIHRPTSLHFQTSGRTSAYS